MAEKIKIFEAAVDQLFDQRTIDAIESGDESYKDLNSKLLKSCKKVITWKGKYMIAINEFMENKRQFRIATPVRIIQKTTRQFSFGAWDQASGEIYLFFNAGKDKAKSRSEAFFFYRELKKICKEHYPTLLPFAIKL